MFDFTFGNEIKILNMTSTKYLLFILNLTIATVIGHSQNYRNLRNEQLTKYQTKSNLDPTANLYLLKTKSEPNTGRNVFT